MFQQRQLTILVSIVLFSILPVNPVFCAKDYFKGLSEKTPMIVDKHAGEIRLLATLQPKAFGKGWFKQLPGHHAVTWKGGKKADEALLATYASDSEVYDAMISIGAKPGNNLTQAVWDERNNENSKAPDTRVEGSPVDALVWWEGLPEPLPFAKLLKDPGVKGVDLRFGGNKALIPIWKSGCVVCLQSCPGAKISNHQYTIRDYVQGRATFTVDSSVVPRGTWKAVVFIRMRK
jgi:hypothetical protein